MGQEDRRMVEWLNVEWSLIKAISLAVGFNQRVDDGDMLNVEWLNGWIKSLIVNIV